MAEIDEDIGTPVAPLAGLKLTTLGWTVSAVVPTGSTGSISITFTGSGTTSCGIGKYRVLNRTSLFDTNSNTTSDTISPATNSCTINVGTQGAIIGAYALADGGFGGSEVSWGNITKDYASVFSANNQYSGASQTGLSAQTGRNITTSAGSTGSAGVCTAIVSIT